LFSGVVVVVVVEHRFDGTVVVLVAEEVQNLSM